jgi:hypothetical protein
MIPVRNVLDYMIWEMGQAYDGLFAAIRDLRDDDWTWLPDGGRRSISAIVGHVASCKVMYDNHAFGDASLTWTDPLFDEAQSPPAGGEIPPERLVDWLRESQFRVLRNVDALADDDELLRPRAVNWGGTMPTRWIINRLIHHDSFHAGEINHLRAIHQHNDRWEWEQEDTADT